MVRGGNLTVSDILGLYEVKGVGHAPERPGGDPRSVSLNASYHMEQQYLWFRRGVGSERFLRY